jgi:hypothetical protein
MTPRSHSLIEAAPEGLSAADCDTNEPDRRYKIREIPR